MIGQSILRIVPLELAGEENEIVSRIRRGERIDHFETKRRRKDGTVIDVPRRCAVDSAVRDAVLVGG